jgi:hypothetical protein
MEAIKAIGGELILLDQEDLYKVKQYQWHTSSKGVVYRLNPEGTPKHVQLARSVTGASSEQVVVHRNGNRLDCRRENLEIIDRSIRIQAAEHRISASGYRGVSKDKRRNKYQVHITVNGKAFFLGRYSDAVKAARVYDRAALDYFGPSAKLNFPIAAPGKIEYIPYSVESRTYYKACKYCSEQFTSTYRRRLYCSTTCRERAFLLQHPNYYADQAYKAYRQIVDQRPDRTCGVCGAILPTKNLRRMYCSDRCSRKAFHLKHPDFHTIAARKRRAQLRKVNRRQH